MTTENTPSPDQIYLDQLRLESVQMPDAERTAHEAIIAEFAGSLALDESIQRQAQEAIDAARAYSTRPNKAEEVPTADIDLAKIGWITSDEVVRLAVETKGSEERRYLFGSVIDMSRPTKEAYEKFAKQKGADQVIRNLEDHGIPKFLDDLQTGRGNLRPVHASGRGAKAVSGGRTVNTSYPAYKLDVLGNNNRAIVIVLPKSGETPVVALAAIFSHDDQKKVLSAICQKAFK